MGGGGGGEWGGGEDSFSLVFENSIVLIKCTLYDTVFQRQVSICRGVVFSYSFSIYCAAYHGIWCSDLSSKYTGNAHDIQFGDHYMIYEHLGQWITAGCIQGNDL